MSNDFVIVSQSDIDDKEWDSLVIDSPDGWLYQTTNWINFAEQWGSKSVSFGVRSKSGELLALFPLYRDDLIVRRFFRIKRLYTGLSGPVVSPKVNSKVRHKIWKAMFENVDEVAKKNDIDLLQVRLTTVAQSCMPPLRPLINPLYYVGLTSPLKVGLEETLQPLTRIIYLDKSEEQLLMEMDVDCRSAVRQAERKGVTFIQGEGINDIESYVSIHKESWLRTGLTPHPVKYFEDMSNYLQKYGAMKIFFAEHEGKRIAAIIIHVFKDGVFYWGGCSDSNALSLRPNNFLLWNAFIWAQRNGSKFFEVGHFYPHPMSNLKEYNVGKFKVQFGKDEIIPFEGQKVYNIGTILLLENLRHSKRFLNKIVRSRKSD